MRSVFKDVKLDSSKQRKNSCSSGIQQCKRRDPPSRRPDQNRSDRNVNEFDKEADEAHDGLLRRERRDKSVDVCAFGAFSPRRHLTKPMPTARQIPKNSFCDGFVQRLTNWVPS